MASYNLTNRESRLQMWEDRAAELAAVENGTWPRDINDRMRWVDSTPENAARCCKAEIKYLDDLEKRLAAGEPHLKGYEGWEG